MNRKLKLSFIFEVFCFGILVFLELQGHLNLITVLIPLGLLLMSDLLLSLAHDFRGFPQKLCIVLGLLIYPFSFYFFSQLTVPSSTKWNLLLFFYVRSFIGLWLHFYEQLRRWSPWNGKEFLLLVVLSLYFGLAANLLHVHSINLFDYLQHLQLPKFYKFNLNLFITYAAVHALFCISMRALRKFQ